MSSVNFAIPDFCSLIPVGSLRFLLNHGQTFNNPMCQALAGNFLAGLHWKRQCAASCSSKMISFSNINKQYGGKPGDIQYMGETWGKPEGKPGDRRDVPQVPIRTLPRFYWFSQRKGGEKSVRTRKVESICSVSLPFRSDFSLTVFHSGSSWKDFQLAAASSRLGCWRM